MMIELEDRPVAKLVPSHSAPVIARPLRAAKPQPEAEAPLMAAFLRSGLGVDSQTAHQRTLAWFKAGTTGFARTL